MRGKINILRDLLDHIEDNDIDLKAIKEYYKELMNSFNRRINKL